MYGNVEGQLGVVAPGDKALSDPPEENPYEPLDPPCPPDVPSGRGGVPCQWPCWGPRCPRGLLVALVALGVSVLLNVLLLSIGSRQVSALREELEVKGKKAATDTASQSFQLYNEDHQKCVEATESHYLTATACRPNAASQDFRWLPGCLLFHRESRRCVTATSGKNFALVRLEKCREDGKLQKWECGPKGLLALAGFPLYFNFGNNPKREVMLYTGNREWSRWVIPGSKETLCSQACHCHQAMGTTWGRAQPARGSTPTPSSAPGGSPSQG